MTNLRKQAEIMGHQIVGALKRCEDYVFYKGTDECRCRVYVDAEGTEYTVNRFGTLVCITGEDWVI